MKITQKQIKLKARSRGFHIITSEILRSLPEIIEINAGTLNVFIQHTSASLAINENADPSVRNDLETFFNRTVEEDISLYEHTFEGPDDMTSHIKASILGASLTIPVSNGNLAMGTWQGIYLCEHRNHASSRRVVLTLIGE